MGIPLTKYVSKEYMVKNILLQEEIAKHCSSIPEKPVQYQHMMHAYSAYIALASRAENEPLTSRLENIFRFTVDRILYASGENAKKRLIEEVKSVLPVIDLRVENEDIALYLRMLLPIVEKFCLLSHHHTEKASQYCETLKSYLLSGDILCSDVDSLMPKDIPKKTTSSKKQPIHQNNVMKAVWAISVVPAAPTKLSAAPAKPSEVLTKPTAVPIKASEAPIKPSEAPLISIKPESTKRLNSFAIRKEIASRPKDSLLDTIFTFDENLPKDKDGKILYPYFRAQDFLTESVIYTMNEQDMNEQEKKKMEECAFVITKYSDDTTASDVFAKMIPTLLYIAKTSKTLGGLSHSASTISSTQQIWRAIDALCSSEFSEKGISTRKEVIKKYIADLHVLEHICPYILDIPEFDSQYDNALMLYHTKIDAMFFYCVSALALEE
jgi:hypothetical protein